MRVTANVFSNHFFLPYYIDTPSIITVQNISSKNVEVLRRHIDTPSIITVQNISSKNVEVLRRHIDTPSITNDQHLVSPPTLKRTD